MSHKRKTHSTLTIDDQIQLAQAGNYGSIMHYYRLQTGWKAWELALLYSEALREETPDELNENMPLITASWIYMMENQNMVPTDKKRRWILARLLDIPPFLFCLPALKETFDTREEPVISTIFTWETVDIVEYRNTLEIYCNSYFINPTHYVLYDIKRRIINLQNEVHYKRSQEKKEMLRLLCKYQIEAARIALNQQCFDKAIDLLSKAITIAKSNKLYDIWAYALRQRGTAYEERGEVTEGLNGFAAAQQDFNLAISNLDAARKLELYISPLQKGLVLQAAGTAYACVARDEKEHKEALKQ